MRETLDFSQQRVLVVEDEWMTASDIAAAFRMHGASVVGPVPSIDEALRAIRTEAALDGAVLDLNLQGETAFVVADQLLERKVPILLATGYGASVLPERYRVLPRCQKPFDPLDLMRSWAVVKSGRSGPNPAELVGNKLLAMLSPDILAQMAPYMSLVDLPRRSLLDVGKSVFLTSGVASCRIVNSSRENVEIGLVGREGVIGLQDGASRSSGRVRFTMLTDGTGARIDTGALQRFACADRKVQQLLQEHGKNFLDQIAANLLASSRYLVPQRIARWILLMTDRLEGNEIEVSHEDIAFALGMRRAGVTIALSTLGDAGAVRNSRRHIEVVDRAALVHAAAGCYP